MLCSTNIFKEKQIDSDLIMKIPIANKNAWVISIQQKKIAGISLRTQMLTLDGNANLCLTKSGEPLPSKNLILSSRTRVSVLTKI